MAPAKLISLAPSPYTRKARWALESCHPDFEVVNFTALFGEPWLRWKLGYWRGKLTLPVLFLPSGGALRDSYDIAVWGSEHRAQGAPNLFPEAHKQAIRGWNEKSEILLGYFRIAALSGAKGNPAALSPLLPPLLRGLGPLTTFICNQLIATVETKYRDMAGSKEKALALLRELNAAVKASGGRHLVGGVLTYADIAVAVPLKLMSPIGPAHNSLGSTPSSFELPGLLEDFPDLVAWRDATYRDFYPAAKP